MQIIGLDKSEALQKIKHESTRKGKKKIKAR